MRVVVIGAGGVGGYFGGRLAQAGADVAFVARGPHLAALRSGGLRVQSVKGDFEVPVEATDDISSLASADYVLVTVKSYDTEAVAHAVSPLIDAHTAVVSLQNGVDNEERLAAVLGGEHVVGGAAYIFATIAGPGRIDHTGGPAKLVMGEWSGSADGSGGRVAALVGAFVEAGVDAAESTDIRSVLWSKFAFICAQAGVTSASQLPIGEIRSVPAGRELFRGIAAEACAVAGAEGVTLPADLPDRHLEFVDRLDPGDRSSLYHDLSHGNRMELDALLGEIVRRGERHGVATPASRAVYGVLAPWAARNLGLSARDGTISGTAG
jgi:2-dehydropantoate 2-reductase